MKMQKITPFRWFDGNAEEGRSTAARETALATGMTEGMSQSYARRAELITGVAEG